MGELFAVMSGFCWIRSPANTPAQIKLFIKIDRVEKIMVKFFRNSSQIYQRLACTVQGEKTERDDSKD